MDSDAEWIDVEGGFSPPNPDRQPRPRPRPRPRPPVVPSSRPPVIEPPHDAPERAPSSPESPVSVRAAVVGGCVGGVLGVVVVLLLVYMIVLRRKLSKVKNSDRTSSYQIRVEDVAHISDLDETTNMYVNTTDLQKLVSSIRAKGKSETRLPTPPRLHHNTPLPYRPPEATQEVNGTMQKDKVVLRAPMPPPHDATPTPFNIFETPTVPTSVEEVMYSNLEECASLPRPAPRLQAPKTSPPPPPCQEPKSPVTHPARPAPAPPKPSSPSQVDSTASTPHPAKPAPPCASLKPTKTAPVVQPKPGAKPTPPTLPKPGKNKALPPLKMVLRSSLEGTVNEGCTTPDTALTHLSPDSTPTGEITPDMASISAKIALLEGHMRTSGMGTGRPTGVRP